MRSVKELSESLARARGISKKEAASIMKDVVEVMGDAIAHDGGISIKGVFTIHSKVRPARSGKCNGHEWSSPAKRVLTIKVGNTLDAEMNPETPA